MSIELNEFVSNLINIVRPNRFECVIEPPVGLINSTMDSSDLRFFIHGGVIPERTFGDVSLRYLGMTLKIPGNEEIQDLNLTVIMDNDWNVRDFFESWANKIADREYNIRGKMKTLFTESYIDVRPLGLQGEALAVYRFFNVFPKMVGEVELNMDTPDTIATFQVTMAYSYWKQMGNVE